jgi:CheY-like chemotaxis protein
VTNALKFTDDGEIALTVSNGANPSGGDRLRFEVRDTGIGISADARHRLFRPFEQEDSSIARRFGGTGLGLSICKHLVEQMQGRIDVMNREGGGSSFWFEIDLPVGSEGFLENSAVDDELFPSAESPPKGHILLAEDNPVNIMFASLLLESFGYTCEIASNGLEAVAAARRGGFDIILMDMQMPKLDGLSATREIRSLAGQSGRVPIIAMTANAMKKDELLCFEAGMDDYVSKPINLRRLSKLIATWVGRSRLQTLDL